MIELTATPFMFAESNQQLCAFLHVLEGSVRLVTDGMTETLEAGDCAYMETRMPTTLSSEGGRRCRVLLIKPTAHGGGN
jgi:glyoxylate utilization-related uncharacterized protein